MIKNILIDRHTKREFFFKSNYKITKLSSIKIFHFQERMHPRKNIIARNIPMMLYRVFKFFRELRFNFPRSVKLSNLVERDFSRVTTSKKLFANGFPEARIRAVNSIQLLGNAYKRSDCVLFRKSEVLELDSSAASRETRPRDSSFIRCCGCVQSVSTHTHARIT